MKWWEGRGEVVGGGWEGRRKWWEGRGEVVRIAHKTPVYVG